MLARAPLLRVGLLCAVLAGCDESEPGAGGCPDASVVPGCFIGDPSLPPEVELLARAPSGELVPMVDGMEVPLVKSPSGRWGVEVVPRLRNKACDLQLFASLRDECSDFELRGPEGSRSLTVRELGDGWGGLRESDAAPFLPVCAAGWSPGFDLDGRSYQLGVSLINSWRDRPATAIRRVKPRCVGSTAAQCRCACDADWVEGAPCPIERSTEEPACVLPAAVPPLADVLVDQNAWPFCTGLRVHETGEVVGGTTGVDGRVLAFGWRAGSRPTLRVEAVTGSREVRFELFNADCVPLLYTRTVVAGEAPIELPTELPAGFYGVMVLARGEASVQVSLLSEADAAPRTAANESAARAERVDLPWEQSCDAALTAEVPRSLSGVCTSWMEPAGPNTIDHWPEPRGSSYRRMLLCGAGRTHRFKSGLEGMRYWIRNVSPTLARLRVSLTSYYCSRESPLADLPRPDPWIGVPWVDVPREPLEPAPQVSWAITGDGTGWFDLLGETHAHLPEALFPSLCR